MKQSKHKGDEMQALTDGLLRAVGRYCDSMAATGAFRCDDGHALDAESMADGMRQHGTKLRLTVTLAMNEGDELSAHVVVEAVSDKLPPALLLAADCKAGAREPREGRRKS